MKFFEVRRVRVKPEYADVYPEVAPRVWLSARRVARQVRKRWRATPPAGLVGGRVLRNEHFEFEGGTQGPQYSTGRWVPRLTILE